MRTIRLTLVVALLLTAVVALGGCTKEPPVNPRLQPPVDPTASTIPVVKDLSLGRAMLRLEQAGLEIELIRWTVQSDLRPGTVVSQEPDAGTLVPKGSNVTIVVAGAPGDVTVPDVKGMSLRDARVKLAETALIPTVNQNSDRDPAEVKVLEQFPDGGASAPVGTRVEIVTP